MKNYLLIIVSTVLFLPVNILFSPITEAQSEEQYQPACDIIKKYIPFSLGESTKEWPCMTIDTEFSVASILVEYSISQEEKEILLNTDAYYADKNKIISILEEKLKKIYIEARTYTENSREEELFKNTGDLLALIPSINALQAIIDWNLYSSNIKTKDDEILFEKWITQIIENNPYKSLKILEKNNIPAIQQKFINNFKKRYSNPIEYFNPYDSENTFYDYQDYLSSSDENSEKIIVSLQKYIENYPQYEKKILLKVLFDQNNSLAKRKSASKKLSKMEQWNSYNLSPILLYKGSFLYNITNNTNLYSPIRNAGGQALSENGEIYELIKWVTSSYYNPKNDFLLLKKWYIKGIKKMQKNSYTEEETVKNTMEIIPNITDKETQTYIKEILTQTK